MAHIGLPKLTEFDGNRTEESAGEDLVTATTSPTTTTTTAGAPAPDEDEELAVVKEMEWTPKGVVDVLDDVCSQPIEWRF